jgi:hypothetical protein
MAGMSQATDVPPNGPHRFAPARQFSPIGDMAWGVSRTVLEVVLALGGVIFIDLRPHSRPYAGPGVPPQVTHWFVALIAVALVIAAVGVRRKARWTAGLLAGAAVVLLVLLAAMYAGSPKPPQPAPPNPGPVCFSGSNTCG